MSDPCNHISNFSADWWNERRTRDYYIDADDCVQLVRGSATHKKFAETLIIQAQKYASQLLSDPTKTDAEKATIRERLAEYECMTECMTFGARKQ